MRSTCSLLSFQKSACQVQRSIGAAHHVQFLFFVELLQSFLGLAFTRSLAMEFVGLESECLWENHVS
jgi:hypothetical protein